MKAEEAMKVLTQAMKDDPEYAYSWHANIAMAFDDELCTNKSDQVDVIANDAASRFMKICFDVETSREMLIK